MSDAIAPVVQPHYAPTMDDEPYRITVNMTRELERRIADYWHEQRLQSKNEAIRALLELALDATEKKKARQK